ncbi:MAG: hypothetical protein HLUCCO17_14235 [Saliniramus fredricksonii]|uniref:Uncharacterized protein n=1 Tax=Saliniramus fredricksonii TaxID=1653334 RepID=A0A0P7X4E3_9HYPH|nr:hypothetical protein [Saliniramus fredricksonii]KPQ09588.1 MAG: hypothetical protein HLUCCO17_14235 [Saliniramus fredricksonii]
MPQRDQAYQFREGPGTALPGVRVQSGLRKLRGMGGMGAMGGF